MPKPISFVKRKCLGRLSINLLEDFAILKEILVVENGFLFRKGEKKKQVGIQERGHQKLVHL